MEKIGNHGNTYWRIVGNGKRKEGNGVYELGTKR